MHTQYNVPLDAFGKACPLSLKSSGGGLSGECKAGLTFKERYLFAATRDREA